MDLSSSQQIQLLIGLIGGFTLMFLAYIVHERWVLFPFILMIPFPLVNSRYGSLNMVIIYMISVSFLFKRLLNRFPLIGGVCVVYMVYALSLLLAPRATYFDHFIYIVIMGSDFLLLWLTYNYIRREDNPWTIFKVLLVLNVIVLAYFVFQGVFAPRGYTLAGWDEWTTGSIREGHVGRFFGPFGPAGPGATYLALQLFITGYLLLNSVKGLFRLLLTLLFFFNFGMLVATGSRGGFLTFIGGCLLFLWFFRHYLGWSRIIKIVAVAGFGMVALSVVLILYTPYDSVYERLADTEVKEGMPDSRSVIWPLAWERIKEKPVLGHGPALRLIEEEKRRIPGHKPMPYPHSLYLHLVYTIGWVGLFVYTILTMFFLHRMARARNNDLPDRFLAGLPTLGLLVFLLFFVDQIKVSFLRAITNDFQHYIFMLAGMFLGFADVVRERSRAMRAARPDPPVS